MFNHIFLLFKQTSNLIYSYLDPGSASMLISAVVAMLAVTIFLIKNFFYNKIKFLKKNNDIPDLKKEYNLVIYSEGGQYWNVFLPIIKELDKKNISMSYFTSKKDDPGLLCELNSLEKKFIGEGYQSYFILNKLKAKMLLMTTPGLDVLQIKRSKGIKHYCHITHSTSTCATYKTFSLDYFDSVLIGGEADKKIIEELENKRQTPKKQVEIIGCTYLDELRLKLKKDEFKYTFFKDKKTTLLIAPTWGKHSLLSRFGSKILSLLINSNEFNIIIRPHPQSFVSEKKLMDDLMSKFPENNNTKWDQEKDGLKAMSHSDILISDFSGIIYDFLLLFEKPVLTFQSQFEKRGREAMDLKEDAPDIKFLNKIGQSLTENDVLNINSIIKKHLVEKNTINKEVLSDAKKTFADFPGESGKRGADFIINILNNIN